jgi:hypothetical protein
MSAELLRIARGVADSMADDPSAMQRLGTYKVQAQGYYQCPACWIKRGLPSPLQNIASKLFRCSVCNESFPIADAP